MMPISYIVALLATLCLIIYYIFGTEESVWEINCEAILHGACAFSWFSILFGRSWLSLIISGILGFIVGFIAFLIIMSRHHIKVDASNMVNEDAEDPTNELIGMKGEIITKENTGANSYIGRLNDSKETVLIVLEDNETAEIGETFEIVKIKGYDIFAKLVEK